MIDILGSPQRHEGLSVTRDEYRALQSLYGFHEEPIAQELQPTRGAALARWSQGGGDRNLSRHYWLDGARMAAWIARYCEPGEDPLKVLVRLACEAGMDVDPEDVEWADIEAGEESGEP